MRQRLCRIKIVTELFIRLPKKSGKKSRFFFLCEVIKKYTQSYAVTPKNKKSTVKTVKNKKTSCAEYQIDIEKPRIDKRY